MLEGIEKSNQMPVAFLGEILDAVHLNNMVSYTLYSNIYDLKNKEIHLYYMSQFDEVVILNLENELVKGERIQDVREFFTTETVVTGDAAYHRFENRFTATKVAAVAFGLSFISGIAVLISKLIKTRKERK